MIYDLHIYIYIYVCIYIYIYISADLSRASSVLDSTCQPTTSSPFPTPTPQSKGQKRTSGQPAQVARQLKSSPPGTQAAGIQDLGARMLRSYHLIILSSSIGDLLRRNSLPQGATGCPTFWPRIQQISLNRCSRPHRSAK